MGDTSTRCAANLTKWLKLAAQRVENWTALDEHYSVGEFRLNTGGVQDGALRRFANKSARLAPVWDASGLTVSVRANTPVHRV
jgi:hypothetical protein